MPQDLKNLRGAVRVNTIKSRLLFDPYGTLSGYNTWRDNNFVIYDDEDSNKIAQRIKRLMDEHHGGSNPWDIMVAIRWEDYGYFPEAKITTALLAHMSTETIQHLFRDTLEYARKHRGEDYISLGVSYCMRDRY